MVFGSLAAAPTLIAYVAGAVPLLSDLLAQPLLVPRASLVVAMVFAVAAEVLLSERDLRSSGRVRV